MINLYSAEEIKYIKRACDVLKFIIGDMVVKIEHGIFKNGLEAEELFRELVAEHNGIPVFETQTNKESMPYGHAICVSINDEIVHSKPTSIPFKAGDVITIDAGLSLDGWYADMARTVVFDNTKDTTHPGLRTYELLWALDEAICHTLELTKPGEKFGMLSAAISSVARKYRLGNVLDYSGHGIGRQLHEMPAIYNSPGLNKEADNTVIREGMVFCLEPMFTLGSGKTTLSSNGWTVWTRDGSLAAHTEDQVAITENGNMVLTRRDINV